MTELTSELSDQISIFVLTGFRFILLSDVGAPQGFDGALSTDLD